MFKRSALCNVNLYIGLLFIIILWTQAIFCIFTMLKGRITLFFTFFFLSYLFCCCWSENYPTCDSKTVTLSKPWVLWSVAPLVTTSRKVLGRTPMSVYLDNGQHMNKTLRQIRDVYIAVTECVFPLTPRRFYKVPVVINNLGSLEDVVYRTSCSPCSAAGYHRVVQKHK